MGIFNLKRNTAKTVNREKRVHSMQKVESNIGFSRAFSMLRVSEVRQFERELMDAAGWSSYNTLRSKKLGISALRDKEEAAVKEAFRKRGIDSETGDLISNEI